jgi:hypothetical protein
MVCGGCPAPDAPGGNNTASSLRPGVYSGSVDSSVDILVDGTLADSSSDRFTIAETIGPDGLPVLSTGAEAVVGDTLVLGAAGDSYLLGTINSIEAVPPQLIISYTLTGYVDGLDVTGTGQTTYNAVNDVTLDFLLTLSFSGTDATGKVVRQDEEQSGTLTR